MISLTTSLVAQTVKRLPTMRETQVQSLGRKDQLGKEMATHSSALAWKIPRTEEPVRLQSVESRRVGHDWASSFHFRLTPGYTCPCSVGLLVLGGKARTPHWNQNRSPPCSSLVTLSMHVCAQLLSRVRLLVTPWTVALQAPLSMGFPRQEYWSGLPCPPPGDLPDPGIEPTSPAWQVDSLPLCHLGRYPLSIIS